MDVSVILCTYNRSKGLVDTLHSLREQRVPDDLDWEVVVVDNNSTDDTRQRVAEFIGNYGLQIRYVKEEIQGLSHARNRGVRESSGRYLHFIEDDELATPGLIKAVCDGFARYKADCIGGRIHLRFVNEDGPPSWLKEELWGFLGYLDYGLEPLVMDRSRHPFGGNMAFTREIFDRVGLFNVDLGRKGRELFGGEETELFYRLLDAGGEAWYVPDALVYHLIDRNRLRKGYFRNLHFNSGYQRSFLNDTQYGRTLAGIPLFLFPQIFRSILAYLNSVLKKGIDSSLRKEMNLWHLLGYAKGAYDKKS